MHIHLRRGDRRVSEQVSDHIDTGAGVGDIAAAACATSAPPDKP